MSRLNNALAILSTLCFLLAALAAVAFLALVMGAQP